MKTEGPFFALVNCPNYNGIYASEWPQFWSFLSIDTERIKKMTAPGKNEEFECNLQVPDINLIHEIRKTRWT